MVLILLLLPSLAVVIADSSFGTTPNGDGVVGLPSRVGAQRTDNITIGQPGLSSAGATFDNLSTNSHLVFSLDKRLENAL